MDISKAMSNLKENKRVESEKIGKVAKALKENKKASKKKTLKEDKIKALSKTLKEAKGDFVGKVDPKDTPLGTVKDNNGTTFDIYEKDGKFVDGNGCEVESDKVKELIPNKKECLNQPVEPVKQEARYIEFNKEDMVEEKKVNEGLADESDPADEDWYADLSKIRDALKDLEGTFFYPDADEIVAGFEAELDAAYDKGPKHLDLDEKKKAPCTESKELDLNERSFNRLFSKFVRENYKNAKNIRVKSVKEGKDLLRFESVLNYKSGKSVPVIFEAKGKIKPEGGFMMKVFENKVIKHEGKNTPIMNVLFSNKDGMIRVEGIKYNFNVVISEGKKAKVYGIIKD